MAVKIRLTRLGSKKNAHYRVVVIDSHSPRDGKSIETIGRYVPQAEPSVVDEKGRAYLVRAEGGRSKISSRLDEPVDGTSEFVRAGPVF